MILRVSLSLFDDVLGDRGDSTALPAVLAAAEGENASARIAAIKVLGTLGDGSVLPVLLKAGASDDDTLAEAAGDSLAELQGADVDATLSDRLGKSSGKERIVLVTAIGRRGNSRAIPLLLGYMSADDAVLRNAAIDALGMTVGLKDLPSLVDRLLRAT